MTKDLQNMSRTQLLSLRDEIDTALAVLDAEEKKQALEAAEKAAQSYGYSLSDLTYRNGVKKPAKSKLPAKYRNPENTEATWSGRGRQPKWFKTAIANGTPPEDLEI